MSNLYESRIMSPPSGFLEKKEEHLGKNGHWTFPLGFKQTIPCMRYLSEIFRFLFLLQLFPFVAKKRRNVATLRVRQILWILSQTSDGGSDLRLVDQRTQRVVETWPLPSGRWWAPGEEKGGGLLGSAFSKLCQGSLGGGES